MRYATYLLLALCFGSIMTITAPDWATVWSAKFKESAAMPLLGNATITGTFTYQNDGTTFRTKVVRDTGRNDRYCGTVVTGINTPCTQIVRDGKRYLVFPQRQYCCMCCTNADGCGVVNRNWAASGVFTGVQQGIYNEFEVQGLQSNWVWYTQSGIPKKVFQAPQSDMIFDETTYSTAPVADSEFDLPTYKQSCETLCPDSSVCGLARKQAAKS